MAEGQPTAVTMASFDEICVKKGQHIFHSPTFRVYTSLDPIGIEIAGALKNVVAIAAGACVGLGFKSNALSALITRGLAELTRFGAALGASVYRRGAPGRYPKWGSGGADRARVARRHRNWRWGRGRSWARRGAHGRPSGEMTGRRSAVTRNDRP